MHFLSTRILGAIGIVASPWLFIDFINNGLYERFMASSDSGVRNTIFMAGWICSVIGLYRIQAMGNKRWQRVIMIVQIALLLLANFWNIWEIVSPNSPSYIYFLLNFTWPLAGCFMLVTGIVILKAKRLKGWKRYMPLLAGCWFPQTVLIYYLTPNSLTSLILSGLYSAVVFSLLGLSLVIDNYQPAIRSKPSL